MPPLTGLNVFMISILQRCHTYGAEKQITALDAEGDALSLSKRGLLK